MPDRSNIRPTATETMYFIDNNAADLADWLVAVKGMEKAPVTETRNHWAVLHDEGMELIIDPPSSLGSATIKCYGRKKLELAGYIDEYRAAEDAPIVERIRRRSA